MVDALEILRPGVRQIDLSAVFLRRIFELGASANGIDPIWQVMAPDPRARTVDPARRPRLPDGHHRPVPPAKATSSGSTRASPGEGYASDYGRTWITGAPRPNAKQQRQFRRWRARRRRRAGHPQTRRVGAASSARPPSRPTTACARGSTTSTWRTASAPTVPKCRSSEPTSAKQFDERLIMQPGMVRRLRTGHLGGRCRRLSIGRHCGRDRYGLGQAQRLDVRAVRGQRMSPVARDRGLLVGTMGLEDDARVDFARLRARPARTRCSPAWNATISTR